MAALTRIEASSAVLLVFLAFLSSSEARDHLVGGRPDAWKIPDSPESETLNHWASKSRFLVGDSLVWKFNDTKDSVLQVTKRDYVTCNTSSPIAKYTEGNTRVTLVKSGLHYFISGEEGHCRKGQRLIVVVISERHRGFPGVSPAPSPAEIEGPAAAPAATGGAGALSGGLITMALALGGLLVAM